MKKQTQLLIGIIIVILITMYASELYYRITIQKQKDAEIERLKTEKQTFEISVKDSIARQEQRIVTLQMAKEALLIDVKELREKGIKDAQAIISLKIEVTRLKLEASYTQKPEIIHDTIMVNGNVSVNDYLRVPLEWKFDDQWTFIRGTVLTTGVTINILKTFNEPRIIMGYSRGFFKTSKPIITYEDKNPYSTVRDMSNVVIINKPPFYKTPWFYRTEGVAGVLVVQWGMNKLLNK